MAHTYSNLLVHIVFSTCERTPLLSDAIRPDVHAYIGGILRELTAVPIVVGGMPDHVHILTRVPADRAVSDWLRVVKTNSSRWIKERWPNRERFSWQGGYGAFSASESRREAVIRYIRDQARHHERSSFQDEFRSLLKNHRVEFDERYIRR